MRLVLGLVIMLASSLSAQDRHDWTALQSLTPGETVHVTLKGRSPVTASFGAWTPVDFTAGALKARKEDVLRIERYRNGKWSRGKRAAIFAGIGFGGGFAIGAAAGGCNNFFICGGRGKSGAAYGVVGAIVGGLIGVLWPSRRTELLYAVN